MTININQYFCAFLFFFFLFKTPFHSSTTTNGSKYLWPNNKNNNNSNDIKFNKRKKRTIFYRTLKSAHDDFEIEGKSHEKKKIQKGVN